LNIPTHANWDYMRVLLQRADNPRDLALWIRDDTSSPVRLNRTGDHDNNYFELLQRWVQLFSGHLNKEFGTLQLPLAWGDFILEKIFGDATSETAETRMQSMADALWALHGDPKYAPSVAGVSSEILGNVFSAAQQVVQSRLMPWWDEEEREYVGISDDWKPAVIKDQSDADEAWRVAEAVRLSMVPQSST